MKLPGLLFFPLVFLFCLYAGVSIANDTSATPSLPANKSRITIYFFWGEGCPHCAAADPFLDELAKRYPQVKLKRYEVWHSPENRQLLKSMAAAYGQEPKAVPAIFIGGQYFEGFSDILASKIEKAVKRCLDGSCPDKGAGIVPKEPEIANPTSSHSSTPSLGAAVQDSDMLYLPFVGEVNLTGQSLFISTLLISFVDGFNPCSIWVLTMLLAITLHSGSRKKIIIIGLVYILVTAFIYALFMVGIFTMFSIVNYVVWIRVLVALTALFFALVNIKDYFWYKEGLSFTIADESKPGIYRNIRKVMEAGESTWGMIGGTIVLAAGVSLVEFSCTAGFPVLWTNLLIEQNASAGTFVMLLLIYMLIYQLDELVLFFVAVFSLKAYKMEETYGRLMKLIGGMLMLALALTMLFNPGLMNKLSSSLTVFAVAAAATLLVLVLHKWVLPKLGIYIGTEVKSAGPDKS